MSFSDFLQPFNSQFLHLCEKDLVFKDSPDLAFLPSVVDPSKALSELSYFESVFYDAIDKTQDPQGFFLDLDGTLLENSLSIDALTAVLLRTLKETGHHLALATARPEGITSPYVSAFAKTSPLLSSMGSKNLKCLGAEPNPSYPHLFLDSMKMQDFRNDLKILIENAKDTLRVYWEEAEEGLFILGDFPESPYFALLLAAYLDKGRCFIYKKEAYEDFFAHLNSCELSSELKDKDIDQIHTYRAFALWNKEETSLKMRDLVSPFSDVYLGKNWSSIVFRENNYPKLQGSGDFQRYSLAPRSLIVPLYVSEYYESEYFDYPYPQDQELYTLVAVGHKKADKGRAFSFVKELVGKEVSKFWAFGDGHIDVPMLSLADYPYLMKNARLDESLESSLKSFNITLTERCNTEAGIAYTILKSSLFDQKKLEPFFDIVLGGYFYNQRFY